MTHETLSYTVVDGVAEILLTRPEQANTLTEQLVSDLSEVIDQAAADDRVRAVLLAAEAGPFFCAGGDLVKFNEAGDQLPDVARDMLKQFHPAMAKLFAMPAPVITAVNGATAGIGCSFVLGANIALFSDTATFTMAYTGAGLTPDGGASYFLPRIVGLRRAEELILTNRTLSAAEALDWGIANKVVDPDLLLATARNVAQQIASGPTLAFGNARGLLLASFNSSLEAQLAAEADSFTAMCATDDCREGIAAFLQKRAPNFKGH